VDDLTAELAEHPYTGDPTASLWPGRNEAGGEDRRLVRLGQAYEL
jgi:hypothetical protein